MYICKQGYLNEYVMATGDGGLGFCEWLVSQMTDARPYSVQKIYNGIQNNAGAQQEFKDLTQPEVQVICEWMVGKTFDGVLIGDQTGIAITYVQPVP